MKMEQEQIRLFEAWLKDLTQVIRVTMPDGTKWDVPARLVIKSRFDHYKDDDSCTLAEVIEEHKHLGDYDITDWAAGNMNWDEVSAHAKLAVPGKEMLYDDFQEGWVNGDKEVLEPSPSKEKRRD